jgi:hypothetical protein
LYLLLETCFCFVFWSFSRVPGKSSTTCFMVSCLRDNKHKSVVDSRFQYPMCRGIARPWFCVCFWKLADVFVFFLSSFKSYQHDLLSWFGVIEVIAKDVWISRSPYPIFRRIVLPRFCELVFCLIGFQKTVAGPASWLGAWRDTLLSVLFRSYKKSLEENLSHSSSRFQVSKSSVFCTLCWELSIVFFKAQALIQTKPSTFFSSISPEN